MTRHIVCTVGKLSLLIAFPMTIVSCRETVTPIQQRRAEPPINEFSPSITTTPSTRALPVLPAPTDGSYMGRPLAQTMSHLGASWLTRDERDQEEGSTAMISALQLQPGQTTCDLGAGNGYHTLMMARAVMPGGKNSKTSKRKNPRSSERESRRTSRISRVG